MLAFIKLFPITLVLEKSGIISKIVCRVSSMQVGGGQVGTFLPSKGGNKNPNPCFIESSDSFKVNLYTAPHNGNVPAHNQQPVD